LGASFFQLNVGACGTGGCLHTLVVELRHLSGEIIKLSGILGTFPVKLPGKGRSEDVDKCNLTGLLRFSLRQKGFGHVKSETLQRGQSNGWIWEKSGWGGFKQGKHLGLSGLKKVPTFFNCGV
jgi:hypothetical protein